MIPTVENVVDIANQLLWMAFLMAVPVLATALVVGVSISLIQTVTSVQEMTLTFVPKMLISMAVLALSLPWMIQKMTEYAEEMWQLMSSLH